MTNKSVQQSVKAPASIANKRGMARLAAVQALYQLEISKASVSKVANEYELYRLGNIIDEEQYLEADHGWFRGLIAGVVENQLTLDPAIHDVLPNDWPLERIDILLRAILRVGTFELIYRKDVPSRVVINEFIEVAKAFYDDDEWRMVNAVLNAIAKNARSEDFAQTGHG